MRISDWSSDVRSSDLGAPTPQKDVHVADDARADRRADGGDRRTMAGTRSRMGAEIGNYPIRRTSRTPDPGRLRLGRGAAPRVSGSAADARDHGAVRRRGISRPQALAGALGEIGRAPV